MNQLNTVVLITGSGSICTKITINIDVTGIAMSAHMTSMALLVSLGHAQMGVPY